MPLAQALALALAALALALALALAQALALALTRRCLAADLGDGGLRVLVVRESFSDIVGVGHAHMGLQRFMALGLALGRAVVFSHCSHPKMLSRASEPCTRGRGKEGCIANGQRKRNGWRAHAVVGRRHVQAKGKDVMVGGDSAAEPVFRVRVVVWSRVIWRPSQAWACVLGAYLTGLRALVLSSEGAASPKARQSKSGNVQVKTDAPQVTWLLF